MSMKRSKSERPGFISQVMTIIAGMWRPASRNVEEDSAQNPDDSESAPIGLSGSKWLFGCSAGAAEEIAIGYDMPPVFPGANLVSVDECFHPLEKAHDVKDKSSDDYWIRCKDNEPNPYP